MGRNSTRSDHLKMREVGKKTIDKSNYTKNIQFRSRSVRDNGYSCVWRCKFTLNMCSSHTTAIWNQTKINCKQIKIFKEKINNTESGVSSSTDNSKFWKTTFETLCQMITSEKFMEVI